MNAQPGWTTKLFADTADLASMLRLAADPSIQGFTTNPTLMRRAGVRDYEFFAREAVAHMPDRPISFEVFSDEFEEVERQAIRISGWGPCVYVKVPITNTRGVSSLAVLRSLAAHGVKVNVTAMMTLKQVEAAAEAVKDAPGAFLSIFAGRIADTGRDPVPDHGHGARHSAGLSENRVDLGEPARTPEYRPGQRDWVPHHHGHAGPAGETAAARQRPRTVLPGNGSDVRYRCAAGGLTTSRRAA